MRKLLSRYKISDLIFLYIKGELSEGDKKKLLEWADESNDNRLLFERLLSKESYKENPEQYKKYNNEKYYNNIVNNINRSRRIGLLKNIASVAAILVPIMITFFVLNHFTTEQENYYIAEVEKIKPGGDVATLVLHNGETIQLHRKMFNFSVTKNIKVKNQSNKIRYEKKHRLDVGVSKEYNTVIVPRGGEYKLQLADGTNVYLNSESKIKFPVEFSSKKREVWLEGEAYFEVTHNKTPFFVNVNKEKVAVLGTKFNVMAYNNEDEIVTSLLSGKVVFISKGNVKELKPNEQATYNRLTGDLYKESVDAENVIAWVRGDFYFKSMSLRRIMNQLERWYNFETVFGSKNAENIRYRGIIKRNMEFKDVCKILEETTKVKILVKERKVYINRPM